MKIKELSEITGINPETIRSYRNKGFLHPKSKENGYYDYSIGDYISLAYLKKLRGYDIPLQDIQSFYHETDENNLIAIMDHEEAVLEQQITILKQKIRYLKLERRHIQESRDTQSTESHVLEFQSIDDKIDFYDIFSGYDIPLFQAISRIFPMTTPAVYIPEEILNGPVKDRWIPLQAGIGTYRYVINENHLAVPDYAVVVPCGICLSQVIKIRDLTKINVLDLKPMMNRAKEKNYVFHSGTTGYLIRVEMHDEKPAYIFRIRACVKPNSNRSRI